VVSTGRSVLAAENFKPVSDIAIGKPVRSRLNSDFGEIIEELEKHSRGTKERNRKRSRN